MHHPADIRLVYAHAERLGRDHHGRAVLLEVRRLLAFLLAPFRIPDSETFGRLAGIIRAQPGVALLQVVPYAEVSVLQLSLLRHDAVAPVGVWAEHDAAVGSIPPGVIEAGRISPKIARYRSRRDVIERVLLVLAVCQHDSVVYLGTIEAAWLDYRRLIRYAEVVQHIDEHARRGGSRERQQRRGDTGGAADLPACAGQAEVGRPEVVAPLAYAMGLVHGNDGYGVRVRIAFDARIERAVLEPFGGDVADEVLACGDVFEHIALDIRRDGA